MSNYLEVLYSSAMNIRIDNEKSKMFLLDLDM